MTFASWVERNGPPITSGLAIAGALAFWLLPAETSCQTTPGGTFACANVSLAAGLHNPGLAALLLAASVAFCLIPYLLASRAAVQFAWSGIVLVYYLLSFGVDWTILPAAATGIATGVGILVARRPPPEETAFGDNPWTVPDKVPRADEADDAPPPGMPSDSEGPETPPEDGREGPV